MLLRSAALLALSLGLLPAADLPLGRVDQVSPNSLSVVFDAAADATLEPGTMVALYGGGRVEKHPLTAEVLISHPALMAKAQLLGRDGGRWRARLWWTVPGASLAAGMDVVPLPGEAAPNSTPVAENLPPLDAPQGSRVDLTVAARDPDGDPLHLRWSIEGPVGRGGTIIESATATPSTGWLAPLAAGDLTAVAVVTDAHGQTLTVRRSLRLTAPAEPRDRTLRPWYAAGNLREPVLSHLARGRDGAWWAVTAAVGMTGQPGLARLLPGLNRLEAITTKPEETPRRPVALIPRGDELHVLDAARGAVAVYGTDGALRRTYGAVERPLDLALGDDGTAYIADGADRGIHIIEADGRYRGRLGRGSGDDGLLALAAVGLAPDGTVLALDPQRPALVRFDRFGRRLENWACPGDAKVPAVDVVAHPSRGALVLLANGTVVPVGPTGLGEPLASPTTAAGVPGDHPATHLLLDPSGTLYALITSGLVLRWDADLQPAGVRGSSLRKGDAWAADGTGRTFALDQASGSVAVFDREQWQTARLATGARKAGRVAASPRGRYLAVTDTKANQVLRLDLTSPTRPPVALGQEGTYDGQFQDLADLAFDEEDRLYALDLDLRRVAVFAATGEFVLQVGGKGSLQDPERVAVAPDGRHVYVYDSDTYELKRFTVDWAARQVTAPVVGGGKGSGPGQVRAVVALACDRRGLLHVLDERRGDLQILDFQGAACQALTSLTAADLDLASVESLALHPDGPLTVIGGGRLTGWHW